MLGLGEWGQDQDQDHNEAGLGPGPGPVRDGTEVAAERERERCSEVELIRLQCLEKYPPRLTSVDLCQLWQYLGLEENLYLVSMRRALE